MKHNKTNVKYIQKAVVQNLLQFLFCPFIVDFTQKKNQFLMRWNMLHYKILKEKQITDKF